MRPHDPIFDFPTITWDQAAQEAAFEGHCFCLLDTGQVLNRAAMREGVPHWNPRVLKKCNADEDESSMPLVNFE